MVLEVFWELSLIVEVSWGLSLVVEASSKLSLVLVYIENKVEGNLTFGNASFRIIYVFL